MNQSTICICLLTFVVLRSASAQKIRHPLEDSIDKYDQFGQYEKVISFTNQWGEIVLKETGEESATFGTYLNVLGDALAKSGKTKEAVTVLLRGLAIRKRVLGDENLEVASSYNNLAVVYAYEGDYPKSEDYFLKTLKIEKTILGDEHPKVGVTNSNLGNLYYYMGNYLKSEEFALRAIEFWEKNDNYQSKLAVGYQNLGNVYLAMGNFSKVELLYQKSLAISKKKLGEEHPEVAKIYSNLGALFLDNHNLGKAEFHFEKALGIWRKTLGEDHGIVGGAYLSMGVICFEKGDYFKARTYYLKCLEIQKKTMPEATQERAILYNDLGSLLMATGKYREADSCYQKALTISKKVLGVRHPTVGNYLVMDGYCKFAAGNLFKARVALLKARENQLNQIQLYFPTLSDMEKAAFFETLKGSFDRLCTFSITTAEKFPELIGEQYNTIMATKALLLNASARWKHRIKNSGDTALISTYTKWESYQAQIASLFTQTDSTLRSGLDSTLEKSETLEKELSLRSEKYGKLTDKKRITWQQVQARLKPGEAAIEMVRFQKFGIEKTVTDTTDIKKPTYYVKGLTDTIWYAALIVRPGLSDPEMVVLRNGNEMDGRALNYYKRCMENQVPDTKSYQLFWEKIDRKLGPEVRRVFFSPDGVYHSINLNTLYNGRSGKYLLDQKEIRNITNTRDLVSVATFTNGVRYACLVGYPDYNVEMAKRAVIHTNTRTRTKTSYVLTVTRDEAFIGLPGTRQEIENISDILMGKGWQVDLYLGENALEESIKETQKPGVLHIATHGYFNMDTAKGSNPMLYSGLLLTGANKTLAGEKDDKVEDGILTAYEAMNLNLDNTDLVVLSACETGLGKIKNGEGVYGLQRAFTVAGAKTIIMSLWKVNDIATQELMVGFYKNWLGKAVGAERQTAGDSKRSAFLAAQKELKAKYPNPYYWGAFVMVGE